MSILEGLTNKRVLVIGGTGRVGLSILPALVDANPSSILVTGTNEDQSYTAGCTHLRCRLPDDLKVLPAPADTDVVIVLAAVRPGKANKDPTGALRLNFTTVGLLANRYQGPQCRLVVASSVRSSAADSAYAWSKLASEAMVASTPNATIVVVRLGNIIKRAESIEGILRSLTQREKPDFISSSAEYYQSSFSIPHQLALALNPKTPPGAIITPLLPSIPIPFWAGYLAGYRRGKTGLNLKDWQPTYKIFPSPPPLIPDWWLPFSQIAITEAGPETKPLTFIITTFTKETRNEKKGDDVKKIIEEQSTPNFGQFIQYLEDEGVFDQI